MGGNEKTFENFQKEINWSSLFFPTNSSVESVDFEVIFGNIALPSSNGYTRIVNVFSTWKVTKMEVLRGNWDIVSPFLHSSTAPYCPYAHIWNFRRDSFISETRSGR